MEYKSYQIFLLPLSDRHSAALSSGTEHAKSQKLGDAGIEHLNSVIPLPTLLYERRHEA